MKNVKRILAILCVAVLLLLYIITFIMAIMDSTATMAMFKGCVACTIFVPVAAYGFLCLHRYAMRRSMRKDPYGTGEQDPGNASSPDGQ